MGPINPPIIKGSYVPSNRAQQQDLRRFRPHQRPGRQGGAARSGAQKRPRGTGRPPGRCLTWRSGAGTRGPPCHHQHASPGGETSNIVGRQAAAYAARPARVPPAERCAAVGRRLVEAAQPASRGYSRFPLRTRGPAALPWPMGRASARRIVLTTGGAALRNMPEQDKKPNFRVSALSFHKLRIGLRLPTGRKRIPYTTKRGQFEEPFINMEAGVGPCHCKPPAHD